MSSQIAEVRPTPSPEVSTSSIDDDLVVYDPRTGQGHVLNSTASHIWRLSDGKRTVATLAEEISAAHGGSYERVLADVQELVEGLRDAGLMAFEH